MIQDWVYASCMVVFIVALLPQVAEGARHGQTISLWTSIPTALALYVLACTVYTSGYVYGCLVQTSCAGVWTVLAIERFISGPPPIA